ncbi:MAG: hypothetical protein JKX85_01300 [Phycisphaeraceae bacterium]|nr:hypothetical protein [Phycisphaeraceae bacterium]
MSRNITQAAKDAVDSNHVSAALAVSFVFDSGELNLWTGIGELQVDGKTFVGNGAFTASSDIKESTEVVANGVTFSLSGIDPAIISIALQEEYQGRPVQAWFVLFDSAGNVIQNPIDIFAGLMNTMAINEGEETSAISVAVENRLIALDRAKERRYTPEDQNIEFPGDKGFDYVAGLQNAEVVWIGPLT